MESESRKTFGRLDDARNYNKQSVGDISKGEFVAPSDTTVKDIAEAWYRRKKDAGTYRYGTLRNWRIHVDKHIVPTLGEYQSATVEQIETAAPHGLKAHRPKRPIKS